MDEYIRDQVKNIKEKSNDKEVSSLLFSRNQKGTWVTYKGGQGKGYKKVVT